ncbi:MAG: hypothetical protein M3342_24265 [Bacteroidota bacterium]|nr:hypothetical protein [Bacteroidota bacterium]
MFAKQFYLLLFTCIFLLPLFSPAQNPTTQKPVLFFYDRALTANTFAAHDTMHTQPLQMLALTGVQSGRIKVMDGIGKEYVNLSVQPVTIFVVGGALGRHTVQVLDNNGRITHQFSFYADAKTEVNDGGEYKRFFDLLYKGMWWNPGKIGSVSWNGKTYHYFVPWGLDHFHTMKGLQYFNGQGAEFVDLCREAQREDGMIWSFVQYMPNADYWLTRDKNTGYSRRIGDRVFVRQPTENHPEYIYVSTIYKCWKASGDTAWMKKNLVSAAKALDYTVNDPARWSKRFGLLKRVYTIDSWDFQVEDEYLPDLGITNSMILDPVKSKFGVFFGDNTGYITACYQLAEMFDLAGNHNEANRFRTRGSEIKERLDKLAWNGRFFTHFIEEDPTVKRNLGVDEKSQIAQSNAYSINRDISPAQKKAIIETYLDLRKQLPVGSPGEWYAIYPPFQRGFGQHNAIWQYMNGGVGGHVAGELARGAFENGYEKYGADILRRLFELGKKYDNKIYFAYTGSIPPPPPPPRYKPLDLRPYANMDYWDIGSNEAKPWMLVKRKGDDLHNLPPGEQMFSNIRFNVIDPGKNNRKAVVAVSRLQGFPSSVEIPVNDTAGSIYLLHTSTKPTSENVVGNVAFEYNDGSRRNQYIIMDKHLTYWWFSQLKTDRSGIAWYGKNDVSEGVGLSWCAIDNPSPKKIISKVILQAPADSGIYTVLGITLADKPHYVPVNPVSFGGPDNWAAATVMAALIEGQCGVRDKGVAFRQPIVSPRWVAAGVDSINVTVRYPASDGYVAYRFRHDEKKKQIKLTATGNAEQIDFHVLLPDKVSVQRIAIGDKTLPFKQAKVDASDYADFSLPARSVHDVVIYYQ